MEPRQERKASCRELLPSRSGWAIGAVEGIDPVRGVTARGSRPTLTAHCSRRSCKSCRSFQGALSPAAVRSQQVHLNVAAARVDTRCCREAVELAPEEPCA